MGDLEMWKKTGKWCCEANVRVCYRSLKNKEELQRFLVPLC